MIRAGSRCIVPDMFHGVRMSHSDDLVTVFYGADKPLVACGFCAKYYLQECYRAARENTIYAEGN